MRNHLTNRIHTAVFLPRDNDESERHRPASLPPAPTSLDCVDSRPSVHCRELVKKHKHIRGPLQIFALALIIDPVRLDTFDAEKTLGTLWPVVGRRRAAHWRIGVVVGFGFGSFLCRDFGRDCCRRIVHKARSRSAGHARCSFVSAFVRESCGDCDIRFRAIHSMVCILVFSVCIFVLLGQMKANRTVTKKRKKKSKHMNRREKSALHFDAVDVISRRWRTKVGFCFPFLKVLLRRGGLDKFNSVLRLPLAYERGCTRSSKERRCGHLRVIVLHT
jgi:hypothetical protein